MRRCAHANAASSLLRPPHCEDTPPGPQGLWMKILCGIVVVMLTMIPCVYLLLFGVQQGKAKLKVWWISSMTGFALGAVCYEVGQHRRASLHSPTAGCATNCDLRRLHRARLLLPAVP